MWNGKVLLRMNQFWTQVKLNICQNRPRYEMAGNKWSIGSSPNSLASPDRAAEEWKWQGGGGGRDVKWESAAAPPLAATFKPPPTKLTPYQPILNSPIYPKQCFHWQRSLILIIKSQKFLAHTREKRFYEKGAQTLAPSQVSTHSWNSQFSAGASLNSSLQCLKYDVSERNISGNQPTRIIKRTRKKVFF